MATVVEGRNGIDVTKNERMKIEQLAETELIKQNERIKIELLAEMELMKERLREWKLNSYQK